jgi:beta-lactam-binding protein with PASTA domain
VGVVQLWATYWELEQATVPDLTGLSPSQAFARLRDAELVGTYNWDGPVSEDEWADIISQAEANGNDIESGSRVNQQNPAPGTRVDFNSSVTFSAQRGQFR